MSKPYFSETIQKHLKHFQRLNEHFSLTLGKQELPVPEIQDPKILYILMTASHVMDVSEEGLFENLVITDKALTGREEMQIDAYALVSTDSNDEKHLHLFQYKFYETGKKHSASPIEVKTFVDLMNDLYVHPELSNHQLHALPVFQEIQHLKEAFEKKSRSSRIKIKCHFITNAVGMGKSNTHQFEIISKKHEYDKHYYGFDFQIYGEQDIIDLIEKGKLSLGPETLTFEGGTNAYRLEDNRNKKRGLGLPEKCFIGFCNVHELIRLQNKYHENELYSDNIRLYLGDRVSVNQDIIRTVTSEESNWFPYMNNGITIICDKLDFTLKGTNICPILTNLQIINGCQTVNALYSAKYHEKTREKFKSTSILVKIYQIAPSDADFKRSVIIATNNQNKIMTASLYSNEPIQIAIQQALEKIGYLYDRKGESKNEESSSLKIISLTNAALAYRAVYQFEARNLRWKIGKSRIFEGEFYQNTYNPQYLEDPPKLHELASKLLIADLILDGIRDYIREHPEYTQQVPVFKKSAYHLCGLMYAYFHTEIDELIEKVADLMEEENVPKRKGLNPIPNFLKELEKKMPPLIEALTSIYAGIEASHKIDLDNLLKSEAFDSPYQTHLTKRYAP